MTVVHALAGNSELPIVLSELCDLLVKRRSVEASVTQAEEMLRQAREELSTVDMLILAVKKKVDPTLLRDLADWITR